MRSQLLRIHRSPSHSFSVRRDLKPDINNLWHYHPEIELIHFKKGNGTQFVGDSIRQFQTGDVVLIGSKLPHFWRFDEDYFPPNTPNQPDITVAHFKENFWGDDFLNLPENARIRSVLEKAKRGIKIEGNSKKKVSSLLERMLNSDGPKRIIILLQVLIEIANNAKHIDVLSSVGFNQELKNEDSDKINDIYNFTISNLKRKILLEEISSIAGISPNSFCRYFKSRTGKTFSQFQIELKVGNACKLLIKNNLMIKQVSYESGFNNFACFHKHFKSITGKSPLEYRNEYLKNSNNNEGLI